MTDIILRNNSLTVRIAPLGAEIQSICDGAGMERIWQGHPGYWSKHAPVLFPVAGGLREDTYLLDGKRYIMDKHGFVRERLFVVEEQTNTSATFLLTGEAAAHAGFPFAYTLRARYTLCGDTLTAQTIVENMGETPLWYSAGAHEAYACAGGASQWQLVFDEPETLAHSRLDRGLLTGETTSVPMDGKTLPLEDAHFANDTLVLASLASRSVTLQSELHPGKTRISFPDFDYLLVWTQVGAEFLCVEPWHNLPDRADTDQDITRKPGMIQLDPGQVSTLTHTMTFM